MVNALDNVKARNHVNRLCLGADVPLVESGTSGYLGESMIVWKGHTSCYECIVSLSPTNGPTQSYYRGVQVIQDTFLVRTSYVGHFSCERDFSVF